MTDDDHVGDSSEDVLFLAAGAADCYVDDNDNDDDDDEDICLAALLAVHPFFPLVVDQCWLGSGAQGASGKGPVVDIGQLVLKPDLFLSRKRTSA